MSRVSLAFAASLVVIAVPLAVTAQSARRTPGEAGADRTCIGILTLPHGGEAPPAAQSAAPAGPAQMKASSPSPVGANPPSGDASPRTGGRPTLLPLLRASWVLDDVATLATGTLELEFGNDAAEPRDATFVVAQASMTIEDVEADVGGRTIAVELHADDAKAASSARASRVRGMLGPDVKRSETIDLPPGGSVVARLHVRLATAFTDGRFQLELPLVSGTCDEGKPAGPADLAVLLGIRHVGELEIDGKPSLEVATEDDEGRTIVHLKDRADASTDAFRIAWRLGSADKTTAGAWVGDEPARTHASSDDGAPASGARDVSVLLTAPRHPDASTVRAEDVVFIVDTSGSMRGEKIVQARAAVNACVAALHEADAFDVVRFSSDFTGFRGQPVPATPDARSALSGWLDGLAAEGGTMLSPALSATLATRREGAGHRLVVVMTDGALGDEAQVTELLRSGLGDARVLFVAIGADARHETLERLADLGRGEAVQVSDEGAIVSALTSLLSAFSAPVAWDLVVDWGNARVISQSPERVPDLYADRPVVIRARVEGGLPEKLHVHGATTAGKDAFDMDVPLTDRD